MSMTIEKYLSKAWFPHFLIGLIGFLIWGQTIGGPTMGVMYEVRSEVKHTSILTPFSGVFWLWVEVFDNKQTRLLF